MNLATNKIRFKMVNIILILFLFFAFSDFVYASYQSTFVVTSYYSPVPNQDRYVTGSYEGDRRLNGNGTNGASGAQVFAGFIAAPSSFSFGTKIFIPGFGTGEVQDRGGAIKNNRIDLWMGFGDEGLNRALAWGRRTVVGTVYDEQESENTKLEVFFDLNQDVNLYVNQILEALASSYNSYGVSASVNLKSFTTDLGLNDSGSSVKFLQETLKNFAYLKADMISGTLDQNTRMAVISYQIGKGIIDNETSFGAGYVGPQTRKSLETDLHLFKTGKYKKPINYLEEIKKYQDLDEDPEYILNELKKGVSGAEVVLLQEQLSTLGYLRIGEATGYFGEVTEHALKKFQLKTGLIASLNSFGAGIVGPNTKLFLNNLVGQRIETKGMIAVKRKEEEELLILASKTDDSDDNSNDYEKITTQGSIVMAENQTQAEQSVIIADNILSSELDFGDNNEEVQKLQELLKKLGYFKATFISTYYGENTKQAVLAFQLDKGIVVDPDDQGAGRVGPKTLEVLNGGLL
ncbi:hypothetical protein A2307_03690 [Candidatus Peregrinibacteria bacterium RIFOXYB2_FULL_33_20]|nr:MAG: hypothetical protein A2307_03690 [Candidatus Peregrinibacteria bacterium RIFOXYB2_FULL_33_20]